MNLPHRLHHSSPSILIKHCVRCMSAAVHETRNKPTTTAKKQNIAAIAAKKRRMRNINNPIRFHSNLNQISEEQKNLIIQKILTETNTESVLYSPEHQLMHNAYFSNLVIDMVYTTFCETGQGIALYDSQWEMRWKKFIVRKFSPIFGVQHLTPIIERFMNLPRFLSNYSKRIEHFVLYEYDRLSFKKPAYIYPSESFMLKVHEFQKHTQFSNTLHTLHDRRSPYLRRSTQLEHNEQELYHRMNFLFEKTKYQNGLYLYELADVFEYENDKVLSSLKLHGNEPRSHSMQQKGVEQLALNPYFESYYQSFQSFERKLSLKKLVENAGLLYCDNPYINRVMIFPNTPHGRLQEAILTILKNDDYLHTFDFIKTKFSENYPDLYAQLHFDNVNKTTFAKKMLQRFSPLVHIYRIPTINRHVDGVDLQRRSPYGGKLHAIDPKTELIGDLHDLRYQRRYPYCLRVFNLQFNERIFDLVRNVCMKRMICYDVEDFLVDNNGVKLAEFDDLWQSMYPKQLFPFYNNNYALFYHLIEYQSHNVRALPINNTISSKRKSEWQPDGEALMKEMVDETMYEDVEFSGLLIAGSTSLSSPRSLYNREHKLYYYSYQFVPVRPYNNQTYSRLLDNARLLRYGNDTQQQAERRNIVQTMVSLNKEYIQNISYLLKTFRNDGIPLSDFARLFEFRNHNIENSTQQRSLLSFNPDVIASHIEVDHQTLHVGDLHKSLSNLLVVWGALITPKTKPIQQQLVFPLNLGCMNWMILTSMDYFNHKGRTGPTGKHYNIPWSTVKQIGEHSNNQNSIARSNKAQNMYFTEPPEIKLWIIDDTKWLKHQCYYKIASNLTLTHNSIHTPLQLNTFWPNSDANMHLFRRPTAPILDYDMLTLSTLWKSNHEMNTVNKAFKNVQFYKFVDELFDKYSQRIRDVHQKSILHDYLSVLTMRICYILTTYLNEYGENTVFIRWSTFLNRWESLFGRLLIPAFNIDVSHNLIFGVLGGLHCNLVDILNNKEFVQNYLLKNAHFRIPTTSGINQLYIQFPTNLRRKYIQPMIAPNKRIEDIDLAIDMNKYHKQFVPISFLLSKPMLKLRKYNNPMMSADFEVDDWKNSESYYALSIDPLTRDTVQNIMNEDERTQIPSDLNDKFQRLLSRKVYGVSTIKEVLSMLSESQWNELSNTLLRHIMDGFILRGEVNNAYKMLMTWFRPQLGDRYELYTHLCHVYLNHNDVATAYQVYQYLTECLLALYDKKSEHDEYYYESQMLIYCLSQCCNTFMPTIIDNGHFYLFDELVHSVLELKKRRIISSVDPFISNKNLKYLFKTFDKNELINRLLSLIAFLRQKEKESLAHFMKSTFYTHDILSMLQLSSNSNHKLAQEVMQLIVEVQSTVINWYQILQYVIKHEMLHTLLNNPQILQIYDDLQRTGYTDVVQLQLEDCQQIIATYCCTSEKERIGNIALNHDAWKLMVRWISYAINHQHTSATEQPGLKSFELLNEMMCYFVRHECWKCLLLQNVGDAMQWIELSVHLMREQSERMNQHIYEMNGVVVLLQMVASLNEMDLFAQIWTECLSASSRDLMHSHYFTDIVECFINDDIAKLRRNDKARILTIYDDQQHIVDRYDKLSRIIKLFELQCRKTGHSALKQWTQCVQQYQSLLAKDAVANNMPSFSDATFGGTH